MTKLVVVSTLSVFSQVLFGAQSRLLGSKGGECRIPLDPVDDNTPSCIKACLGKHQSKPDSFVCDVSAQWMHHVGGTSSWYPATPPQGTGVHEYTRFSGSPPPCDKNGHCMGCDSHALAKDFLATKVCSVQIDPSDCSVRCDETHHLMELENFSPF